MEGNSTALHLLFDHVWSQIEINGGEDSSSSDGRVGIKPDASFWHHGSQLQLTHYGQDFATASMYFSTITDQTKNYTMPSSSYDALSRLVLDAQQWATVFTPHNPAGGRPPLPGNGSGSGSMWDASSLSRAITYPNGSRCWPQVEGAWPRQGSGDNCFHASLLRGVGGERGAEYTNFAKQLEGSSGAVALTGHKTLCKSSATIGLSCGSTIDTKPVSESQSADRCAHCCVAVFSFRAFAVRSAQRTGAKRRCSGYSHLGELSKGI